MSKKTCAGCEHLRVSITRIMTLAYCGKTKDGLIVPHQWSGGDSITFTRVPDFCENTDKEISSKPAPEKHWISVKVIDICKN